MSEIESVQQRVDDGYEANYGGSSPDHSSTPAPASSGDAFGQATFSGASNNPGNYGTGDMPVSGGFNPAVTAPPGGDRRMQSVDLGARHAREEDLAAVRQERATGSPLTESTISAAVNVDIVEETVPVPSFNIGGADATTSVTFDPDPQIAGAPPGTLAITISTDVAGSTGEPGYHADATILIKPTAENPEIAKEVINLIRQRFQSRLEGLQNKPETLPAEAVAGVVAARGDRMIQYAPENKINAADIIEVLRGVQRDIASLEKETPEPFKALAGDPELSLAGVVTFEVESIDIPTRGDLIYVSPESDSAPHEVAVINVDGDQASTGVIHEDGAHSQTGESLAKWAARYNETVLDEGDKISVITPVEPRGVSADPRDPGQALPEHQENAESPYSLADCQRAFGRYEAFKITDATLSNGQWDSVTVERNVDGTFIRLEKGGDTELEFRIGSRNMSQQALEARLDEFMPLVTEDAGLTVSSNGRVAMSHSELLTRLCRTDKGNAEVTLTNAKNLTFDNVTIGNASLDGATFENCTFNSCVLSASMRGTKFVDCVVKGKSQIHVADGEGLEISGRKSVWKNTVDFSGSVRGMTIGGRSFACNTLAITNWSGVDWSIKDAGSEKRLINGIKMMSGSGSGVPAQIQALLKPLSQSQINSWYAKHGLSNAEMESRMKMQKDLFHIVDDAGMIEEASGENISADQDSRTLGFTIGDKDDILVVWSGTDDRSWLPERWQDALHQPVRQLWKGMHSLASQYLGTSGRNLSTDTVSSIDVYYKVVDAKGVDHWRKSEDLSKSEVRSTDVRNRLFDLSGDVSGTRAKIVAEIAKKNAADTVPVTEADQ